MSQHYIYPIALCQGPRDIAHFAYRSPPGETCNAVCYIWYVASPHHRILVDAGATAATFTARGTPETDIVTVHQGLGRLGIKPEDIDIVIATHLHCDHIALSHLYRKARFVIQKKELDYAFNPHPIDADLYEKPTFTGLNWEVFDGEKEIVPGITVFPTPGHSPGGQSVEISTPEGKAIITGFCATLKTFSPTKDMQRRGWEVTIPLIHQDSLKIYDSVLEVKRRAEIIIPLHEPAFIGKERIPE